MNQQSPRLTLRQTSALAMVLALALSVLMGTPAAGAQTESGVRELDDAEFRWGLNKQSSGPSHGPGHNFMSAGDVSASIPGANQALPESAWKARSGNVTIEKRVSETSTVVPGFADTKTDQSGTAFADSDSKYSGLEMVFGEGTGSVDAEAGTAEIEWDGTVSVLYYSGLVYLTISDPVLEVDSTTAVVTATMGGHRSDRENPAEWTPMPKTEVVLAELSRDDVNLGGEKGFSVTPAYSQVEYTAKNGDYPQYRSGDEWGSFPGEFVDFASEAGAGSFWYSSGTSDTSKPALPIAVSWDAENPQEMPDSGDSGSTKGILGQVIDDTVEDILRAAGTDVSDTAAAWMDEAWKPAQPDAVNAAGTENGTAASPGTGTTADAGATSDVEYESEYVVEYFDSGTPVTAGTVGAAVASAPASFGDGSSSAPASRSPIADQATVPVAASSPLYGADAVYAQTSASQKAENPTHQWQWWVGAALLALAAVLFYQRSSTKGLM